MNKIALILSLTIIAATTASASTVTLTGSDTYNYWLKTPAGTVDGGTHKKTGPGNITVSNNEPPGSTLFVLDLKTGNIATLPVVPHETVVLTPDEFHSPSATSPTSPALSAPTPLAASPDAAARPVAPSELSGVSQLGTFILSLALLVGVIWFVRKLYFNKGQILIEAARKAGIDVPDPNAPIPSSINVDGKYEPPPAPKVQRIPEDAYKAPPSVPVNGYLVTPDGKSYGIGKKKVTIGRETDNDIVINDASVSRHHAVVEPFPGGVQIIDQGSANGTHIDGERVSVSELLPGARLTIGQVPMKYEN